jgi:hypothetical protein
MAPAGEHLGYVAFLATIAGPSDHHHSLSLSPVIHCDQMSWCLPVVPVQSLIVPLLTLPRCHNLDSKLRGLSSKKEFGGIQGRYWIVGHGKWMAAVSSGDANPWDEEVLGERLVNFRVRGVHMTFKTHCPGGSRKCGPHPLEVIGVGLGLASWQLKGRSHPKYFNDSCCQVITG